MKKGILCFLAGIMVMSSANAIASTTKQIDASYTVNDIIINGKNTGKGQLSFIYEGTTYVPLRFISETLGADVSWDSTARNVKIDLNTTSNTTTSNTTSNTTTSNTTTSNTTSNTTTSTTTKPTTTNVTTVYTETYIGYDRAKQIAISSAGGGEVISFSSQLSGTTPKYVAEVLYGTNIYKYEINAKTGSIISSKTESLTINYDYETTIIKFISTSEAQQIARNRVGGGQIISTVSYLDATVPEYEIQVLFGNSVYEVVVNAETGAIKSFLFVKNYYDDIYLGEFEFDTDYVDIYLD